MSQQLSDHLDELDLQSTNIQFHLSLYFDHNLQSAYNLTGFHHHCRMHCGCFLEAKLHEGSLGTF